MLQIIPENREKSFSEKLLQGLGAASREGSVAIPKLMAQQMAQKKENETLKQLTGEDVSGLSPELKKIYFQNVMKKKEEDLAPYEEGISSIKEMRDIISRGNTGFALSGLGPKGLADRAALDAAALRLEKIGATMMGKGTLSVERFKYLKDRLPSGWKTDAQNDAILDEWEKSLKGALERKQDKKSSSRNKDNESPKKVKFDSNNPEHQAKAKQLYKTFKDKEKVREKLKLEFEGL